MKLLLKNIKILSVLILAISFLGCEEDDEGTSLPEVVAGFTQTIIQDSGTVSFINISENAQNFEWDFGDGTSSTEIDPIKTYASGTYTVTLTASNVAGASSTFEDELTITIPGPPPVFDSGLLTNGGFENGTDSWIGNAANAVTEGGNTFNQADVETAGNAFDVNLSQVLELTQGTNYILTFDASSNGERTIIAGIGLNVDPFTNNTQTVNLTTETQTFVLELSAADFGGADSRVLFDMGADTGIVVIDNVSLVEGGNGGETTGCSDTPIAATQLPLDFEGCETFLSDANFGSGLTSGVAENPSKTGINTSDFALRVDKVDGADFFAGVQNTFESNFDLTTTDTFKAKIYSSKANVVFRFELALDPQTDPPTGNPAPVFVTIPNADEWTEVDVTFTGLPGGPMAYNQLVIKPDNAMGDPAIVGDGTYYIDDIILGTSGSGGGDTPTTAAPTPPARDAADVVSLFSNAYTDITVDTFYAGFSAGGGITDEQVAGDDVKRYTDLDFAGVETISASVDLSAMTNFHLDVWTATSVDLLSRVVDFGGDGFGGGNDTQADETTTLAAGSWTSIDVTIADLQAAGLTATPTDFNQLILDVVGVTGTIFVDNIYFYNTGSGGGGDTPTTAAPTPPARDAADVVSLFSNAYTDITVDTFYAGFSAGGGITDEQVAGDDVKRYTDLDFAGVETISASVDLSAMTNFHLDVWTATSVDLLSRVVDFGGDGFGGGNDTQADETTTLAAGSWTSIDVTIADLQAAGLTATPTDFNQLILDVVGVTGTIFVDNIYFYNAGSGGGITALSSLPADFEGGEEFSAVFEPASVNGAITSNTVSGGINTSANIYTFNKPSGTEFYGGMENVFATPLDLATTRTFKVKVYSTKPNVVFRFELQTRPDGPNFSIDQSVTNANEWVELTFDFNAVTSGDPGFNPNIYNAIVIIPDFDPGNDPTSTTETYYIDDVILE